MIDRWYWWWQSYLAWQTPLAWLEVRQAAERTTICLQAGARLSPSPESQALWRRRVIRLASVARAHIHEKEEFLERPCDRCGLIMMVNPRIYPLEEPFTHSDSLYDPKAPGGRDGYWWACAVNGLNPDGLSEFPLQAGSIRVAMLAAACEEVGLKFGSGLCEKGITHEVDEYDE